MFNPRARDTDEDWRELGATEPFWAVLTTPEFRSENLTSGRMQTFYDSGAVLMDRVAAKLDQITGVRPGGRALDFGCGTGRLAKAMTRHASSVVGYDISPGMLKEARRSGGDVTYTDTLPDGPFDWINSFIVFQHIPPERGLALLEQLLDRLAPGGHVSLQLTVWREARLRRRRPPGWRGLVVDVARALERSPTPPKGLIMMYDYDLARVLELLDAHGVEDVLLEPTNHDGHRGVTILARRNPAPTA